MIGINHTIILLAGVIGLLFGGVLIDLDHKCSWNDKWRGFRGLSSNDECIRGILHKPLVMLSLVSFFICLGFAILIHYLADYTGW